MSLVFTTKLENGLSTASFRRFASSGVRLAMIPLIISLQQRVVRTVREKYLKGGREDRLTSRTGVLSKSIRAPRPTLSSGGWIEGDVVADADYAAIHEHGGTVLPRRGAFLAIPLKAGVSRGAGFTGSTFVVNSTRKAGNKVVLQRQGAGVEPLFALTPSVTLPARPFLAPALEDNREIITATLMGGYLGLLRRVFR